MKIPRCAIMDEQKVFIPRSIFTREKEGPKNNILALCFRWNSRVVPFCMKKAVFAEAIDVFREAPPDVWRKMEVQKSKGNRKSKNPKQKQWDRQNAEQAQKEKRQIKPRADAKADVELTAMKALEFLTFGSEWKVERHER